jgi:AraC-like DNA-binding protein
MSKLRQARDPAVRTLAMRYPDGFVLDAHAHAWSQLLHASAGVMVVETHDGLWVVPPHRGVWIPAGTRHSVTMRGEVAMRTVYFDESTPLPLARPCVVEVAPLLRELLAYCGQLGKLDPAVPHEARLAGLLIDLVSVVEAMPLALPMPRDPRALRLARALREAPADDAMLGRLVRRAGASLRTIERLFAAETGMPFGRWRQQARLLAAMTMLAEGMPVTRVALEVGYASPSAFIAMFRSAIGKTPSQFLPRRNGSVE